MELVSASKMRRSIAAATSSRPFVDSLAEVLSKLTTTIDVSKSLYFTPHFSFTETLTPTTKLYIILASNRGLAGSYNSNVFKSALNIINADIAAGLDISVITVGKKAGTFAAKLSDVKVLASFDNIPDRPSESDIAGLLKITLDHYNKFPGLVVSLVYTYFKSSIAQEVKTMQLLPLVIPDITEEPGEAETDKLIFEPNPSAILQQVAERSVEVGLWQAFLESEASEQAARMMAMKTATDNAGEIIDDLTLTANGIRQAAITQELAEITAGASAIN
jgi:F-type H+-transporting ATPase subunit gamma